MGKLIVELPDVLHAQLKKQAAADHKTLKVIVTTLLGQYLRHPAGPPAKGSTQLCGAWKDFRTAEALAAELRAARRLHMRERA